MRPHNQSRTAACVSAFFINACVISTVDAAPLIFFGENQSPAQIVSGAPLAARDAFLSNLVGVGTETFESQVFLTTAPLAISFPGSSGNITATITGSGQVFQTPSSAGRFNTTGATVAPAAGKWWSVEGAFVIDFSTPISAFGFFGTDIGDFNGQVTVALTDAADNVSNLTISNTVNGNDGSLLFWGFTDSTVTYKRVSFGNTAAGVDFFGFDDFVIGDQRQLQRVPEPGTIGLLALGLTGFGLIRRRRGGVAVSFR